MKKFLLTFFTLILMALVTALTVPFFIPLEEYKKAALDFLQEKTGHKVTIAGDVSFTLLPQVALKLEGVQIDNPSGFTSPYLAKIGKLELAVEAMPLLKKQVKVSALSLTSPDIWLEENRAGQANWQIKQNKKAEAEAATSASENNAPSFTYDIGQVNLSDAKLHLLMKGENIVAEDVNAAWQNGHANFQSNITYQDTRWNVGLSMDEPLAWFQGGTSPLELNVSQSYAKVAFTGKVQANAKDIANSIALKGKMSLGISSLSEFTKSLKMNATVPDKSLAIESANTELTKRSVLMNPTEIQYDGHQANGHLGVDWSKKKIGVAGKLAMQKFDFAEWKGKEGAADGVDVATTQEVSREWDNKPIDLSFLNQFSMDLELALGELVTEALIYEDVRVKLRNQAGNLALDLDNLNTLDGVASGKLNLNAAGSWQSQLSFQNINFEKAASLAMERSRLRGLVQGDIALSSSGKSLRDWMKGLQGGGKFLLPEGQIDGFSLPKLFRNMLPKQGEAESTSNANLALQFVANQGVFVFKESSLRAQELLADISGNVDMGNKHVDLRLRPKIAPKFNTENTDAGQMAGLMVPLKVIGRFENISVRPDAKAAVLDALTDPNQAKENFKILKREGETIIKNLEDQKDSIKDSWKELKKNKSTDALGGLLNNLDQSGVGLPKMLDVFKKPTETPAETKENTARPVDGGAGAGEQPDPGPVIDSGGEGAGQQPPAPDQSGAPATP